MKLISYCYCSVSEEILSIIFLNLILMYLFLFVCLFVWELIPEICCHCKGATLKFSLNFSLMNFYKNLVFRNCKCSFVWEILSLLLIIPECYYNYYYLKLVSTKCCGSAAAPCTLNISVNSFIHDRTFPNHRRAPLCGLIWIHKPLHWPV